MIRPPSAKSMRIILDDPTTQFGLAESATPLFERLLRLSFLCRTSIIDQDSAFRMTRRLTRRWLRKRRRKSREIWRLDTSPPTSTLGSRGLDQVLNANGRIRNGVVRPQFDCWSKAIDHKMLLHKGCPDKPSAR